MVTPKSLHGVQGAARSNRAAPTKAQARAVNTFQLQGVNSIFLSNPDLNLESVRDIFIRSSVHKSPKTISTLSERLRPFAGGWNSGPRMSGRATYFKNRAPSTYQYIKGG